MVDFENREKPGDKFSSICDHGYCLLEIFLYHGLKSRLKIIHTSRSLLTHHKGSESPFSSVKIKLAAEQSAQEIRLFRKCKSVENIVRRVTELSHGS